ncbi:MAG: hypothetical protein LBP53_04590 [Candidatus Peribacteria bacterium]|jgi:adenylosuccinate synthase|nr:hypothetical protein [Candidatus Peribacteria bacterium]
MMADINEIINYRASSFERRLKNETQFKQAGGNDAFKELIDKKKKLQQQLNYPFDNAEAKDGYTALVFGYQGDGAGHQEKFISSPLMVKETSDNIIEKQTKKYFLENLQNFDKAYNTFAQTKDKIIDTMKEIDGAFNTTISDQDIIDALVEGKEITLTVNGKEQKITLSADFNLGFFADCINEAIMMSPIDIKYT